MSKQTTVDFRFQLNSKVMHRVHSLVAPQFQDIGIVTAQRFTQDNHVSHTQYLVTFTNQQGAITPADWYREGELLAVKE